MIDAIFGRDAELARIAEFVARVKAGRGGLLVIAGAPGIGKTTLADHAAAVSGMATARGAAWDTGGAPALWPWSQVLRSIRKALPPATEESDRFAQLEAISAAISPPLLIVLDDLHAADPSSLAALRVVVEDARTRAVGVLATRRDVGLDGEVAAALARIDRLGEVITLGGVDAGAARAIVARRLAREPADGEAETLVERTGGNPFLIQEIAASGGATRGVRDAVLAHLGQLRTDEVALLGVAAVIGRAFEPGLLAAAAKLDEAAAGVMLDHAVVERLIVREGAELRFAHALLRDTLHDALATGVRRAHHGATADAWMARAGRPAEIARHLRLAGRPEARTWARAAIDAAVRSSDELADAWDAWLELGGASLDDRLSAGEAALGAGRRARGNALFDAAYDDARRAGDADREARALVGRSATVEFMDRSAEHVARIDEAIARRPTQRWLIELHAARARHAAVGRDDAPIRRAAAQQALALAEAGGEPAHVLLALDARLHAAYGADSLAERLELGTRMAALATEAGVVPRRIDALRWLLGARAELGKFDTVDADLDEYLRLTEAIHAPGPIINARMRRAARAWHLGRWADGEREASIAYAIGRRSGDPQAELMWTVPRLVVAIWRGDEAQILAGIPMLLEGHRRLFAPFLPAVAAWGLASIGKLDEAMPLIADLAAAPSGVPDDFARLTALAAMAEVVALAGDRQRAAALHDALAPYSSRNVAMGAFGSLGSVAHRLGELSAALGRRDDAIHELRAAVAAHDRWDARPMLAFSLAALAELTGEPDPRARSLAIELGLARLIPRLQEAPAPRRRAWMLARDDGWTVGLDRAVPIAPRKGLAYVAALVAQPGVELDALTLAGGAETVDQTALAAVDAAALAAYRRRITELRETLDDNPGNTRARAELEALEDEVVASQGKGGRTRTRGGSAERARSTVTVAIRRALDAIAEVDAPLADHLRRAIRTGHRCNYVPDPNLPLDWVTL